MGLWPDLRWPLTPGKAPIASCSEPPPSISMRSEWFDFWQRAQEIHRTASKEPDVEARPKLVSTLVGERIQTSSGRLDFRELHSRLERAARLAIEAPQLDKSR